MQTIISLARDTIRQWRDDDVPTLAASLAFYTAISIAPLLMALIALVGAISGRDAAERELVAQLGRLMGEQGAAFAQIVIEAQAKPPTRGVAGLLELVVLLWGAANVFGQLLNSLNNIWNVKPRPGKGLWRMLRTRLFSFGLVLAIGFLLLVSLVLSTGVARLIEQVNALAPVAGWIGQLLNLLLTAAGATFLFALLFKYVPDIKISWRVTWLGAAVTAVLFVLGTVVLDSFLASRGAAYGAGGSVVVFLLWVYMASLILFLGAELTQVHATRVNARVEPGPEAESIAPRPTPRPPEPFHGG